MIDINWRIIILGYIKIFYSIYKKSYLVFPISFIIRNSLTFRSKSNIFIANSFVGKKQSHSFQKSFIIGRLFMVKFIIAIPFSLSYYRNA